MTRSLTRSDLDEIEDFFNEFGEAGDAGDEIDDFDGDVSIDTLIAQLEASFDTVSSLTQTSSTAHDDLRTQVQELAQRLEHVATELAQINQKLQ